MVSAILGGTKQNEECVDTAPALTRSVEELLRPNERAVILNVHPPSRLSRELSEPIYLCCFGQRRNKPTVVRRPCPHSELPGSTMTEVLGMYSLLLGCCPVHDPLKLFLVVLVTFSVSLFLSFFVSFSVFVLSHSLSLTSSLALSLLRPLILSTSLFCPFSLLLSVHYLCLSLWLSILWR